MKDIEINQNRSERGQAIILITLAMVALLGFTAVAVDGSMAYADRRHVQSASDAASLSGVTAAMKVINDKNLTDVSWDCSSADVQQAVKAARAAAIAGSTTNDMTIDANSSDHHGVTVVCVDTPTDKHLDVIVQMTDQTEAAFAGAVYDGLIGNQVEAVARIRPRSAMAFGYTIVALNEDDCQGNQNGVLFHGNPDVIVNGGGIFSNGCLRGKGSINVKVRDQDGKAVSEGIYYVREKDGCSNCLPTPKKVTTKLSFTDFDPGFTPQELCQRKGAHHIDAGALSGATLQPGLYCISGSLKFSGKKKGHLNAVGVTMVFLDGGLDCNGNCDLVLKAPVGTPDAAYPAVPGLLIYSMASTSWKLNGNNGTYLQGTILAPNADVSLLGTGNEESFKTQIIVYNFEGGGNNASTYKWFDNMMLTKPLELELNR